MKAIGFFAMLVAAAAIAGPAGASEIVWIAQRCTDTGQTPDVRISACLRIEQAQGLEPLEYALASLNLGAAYMTAGDDDRAMSEFDKALDLEPKLWEAVLNRASIHMRRLDLEAAAADLAHADELAKAPPIDPQTLLRLRGFGVRYDPQRPTDDPDAPDKSQTKRDRDIAKSKDRLAVDLARRGEARARNGALDTALADCNAAMGYAPKSPGVLSMRAYVEFRRKDFHASLDDIDASIVAGQKAAAAIYLRGLDKERLGDAAGGAADIQTATASDGKIAGKMAKLGLSPQALQPGRTAP